MTDIPSIIPAISQHAPWNKGKIVGAKPPLRPKPCGHPHSSCEVEAPNARAGAIQPRHRQQAARLRPRRSRRSMILPRAAMRLDRATVRQKKTGRPVQFELTEATRQAVEDCLRSSGPEAGRIPLRRRGIDDQNI